VGPEAERKVKDLQASLSDIDSMVKSLVNQKRSRSRSTIRSQVVGKIVDQELDKRQAEADRMGIELSREIPSGIQARCGREDLRTIVFNLLDNSLYFLARSKRSDKKITVKLEHHGSFVRLDVSDNGPGVRKGERARVFDLFTSVGKATGTGIGLFAVKHYAERAGGRVELVSAHKDDVGSRSYTTIRVELLTSEARR